MNYSIWHSVKDKLPPYDKVVVGFWRMDVGDCIESTSRLLIRCRNEAKKGKDLWRYCPINNVASLTFSNPIQNLYTDDLYWKYIDTFFPLKILLPSEKPNRFQLMDL